MKTNKSVWIPASLAIAAAALLLAYFYYVSLSHRNGGIHSPMPQAGNASMRPRGHEPHGGGSELFKTLGTIAVFLGAAGFSWIWFKKKLNSSSVVVRKAGKLLHAVHKLLGWTTFVVIAAHGIYFLMTKPGDNKIYTGLAGFVILLTIAGYGFFMNKIRNKWMRTIHRSLGILWVPVLLLHAGGSAVLAVLASLAVWVLVRLLEKNVDKTVELIQGHR